MYFHIHVHSSSAWNYVGDVEKKGYPTSKQAKNQAANQKQHRPHKQTRGSIGQFTSKKRKNTYNHKPPIC
jgi:enterochelin esterase-like enzyme